MYEDTVYKMYVRHTVWYIPGLIFWLADRGAFSGLCFEPGCLTERHFQNIPNTLIDRSNIQIMHWTSGEERARIKRWRKYVVRENESRHVR